MLFNPQPSGKLHIDINSCFATIEQQANPFWRGKPLVVAAYESDFGCVLAASREAKKMGVRTGMRVKEARELARGLIIREPDPNKYRDVNRRLGQLLARYSDRCVAKSIDEFVMDLKGTTAFVGIRETAEEIKMRIRAEIGEWISVSIGIAPSRWLAKVASNLQKPDGLEEINLDNFESIYRRLALVDLCGVKRANSLRLNKMGIYNVWDFYQAPLDKLRGAFQSVVSRDWYLRLRGFEVDEVEFDRRSFGNSFVLPKTLTNREEILPILSKLTEKMGFRLRKCGFAASGVWLGVGLRPIRWGSGPEEFWHKGRGLGRVVSDSRELYTEIVRLLELSPYHLGVKSLAVSCFGLEQKTTLQLDLFRDNQMNERLVKALDVINQTWGAFTIRPARMLNSNSFVHDRISFGGVKELEDIPTGLFDI